MDILVTLGVKLATELDLSFDGFLDGIERPSTTLGEIKLFEHSLCSHYPFTLGVKLRTRDSNNNNQAKGEFSSIVSKIKKISYSSHDV